MRLRIRPLLAPALGTALVASVLVGLGLWQLHRLAWKEALLATIHERSNATPAPLPAANTWHAMMPANYEYRHVAVSGRFDNAAEVDILRASADGAGYHVITPLLLDGGGTLLVDRGFVPWTLKDPATRRAGEPVGTVHLTGLLRAPESRNLFTPADDPAHGQFFTRDPAAIAAHFDLPNAAPFSLDVDSDMVNPGGWPRPAPVGIAIPNNHFSYALTWFGLALGLVAVFLAYAWSRLSPAQSRAPQPSH